VGHEVMGFVAADLGLMQMKLSFLSQGQSFQRPAAFLK
jgi:hypothetical protein